MWSFTDMRKLFKSIKRAIKLLEQIAEDRAELERLREENAQLRATITEARGMSDATEARGRAGLPPAAG